MIQSVNGIGLWGKAVIETGDGGPGNAIIVGEHTANKNFSICLRKNITYSIIWSGSGCKLFINISNSVLEGISGNFGVEYGTKAARQLKLSKEQMSFFLLHGELDQGHSHDILDVLHDAPLTPYEWAWCEYAVECTVHLYRNTYNHAAQWTNEPAIV